jgi:hypothetical protein
LYWARRIPELGSSATQPSGAAQVSWAPDEVDMDFGAEPDFECCEGSCFWLQDATRSMPIAMARYLMIVISPVSKKKTG